MNDLRIGVIGLGLRTSLALAAHRPGEGSVVAALCDSDPAVLKRQAGRFEADLLTEHHRELLGRDDLDAVVVMTPDDTHERIAIDCLEAGKAVYLEKPLAITVESADRILRAARRTGTRLYVGHNMRHMGVIRLMRDIIRKGVIGEPKTVWVRHFVSYGGDYYFKDWHADRARTTGLLLQKAAHDLDVIHWLAGGYTTRVNAFGDLMLYGDLPRRDPGTPRPDGWLQDYTWPPSGHRDLHHVVDVEDVSVMNMRLDNGVIAAYQQCHFTPDYVRNYTVIGTEGRLENFGDGPGDTVKVWNTGPTGYRDDADITYRVPAAHGSHGGADPEIVTEFLRFVGEGGVTDTSPVAARMSVAAGYMATMSLRNGGMPYDVPDLDPGLAAYFDRGQVEPGSAGGQ
ncbi:Gfo/Idh/MocA family oxidoreductase [Nonomuraea sp. KC401]|uniref:Gfo/Idh/MocA family protein n=1 Tax=unclassified Nonomuraea TaxID=2593643 RepID=UPI0010FD3F7B|nr:Gfo/Idh/MocA family oxidoreductase [Nonomuraea sp. KC401]NBE98854.1 Gfo/Idh/MocA family oxidoreductase [Nonomuraea sp. K271]TLF59375.1 Gfo/Idh/MocA family oxidoreductase [Nonomuraea sp. KC401]